MNKHSTVSSVPKLFFSIALAFSSQQLLADSLITSDNSFGEGDYYIEDNNFYGISDFSGGSSGGGVDFYGGSFPVPNNSSGFGGGDLLLDLYGTDHNFTGSGGAGAEVLDPSSQLSFIQIDGEAVVDFSFSIATPHTYTLTGNLSANELGRVNLIFDSVTFTELDATYSLTGTLAAGNYSFLINSIAALDSPGRANTGFDFDLQLYDITTVPLPAAFWLFASGLTGLVGLTRRAQT